MFKDVSNIMPNFMFMAATVFEIAGRGSGRPLLVSGVDTKRLGTGRVKIHCESLTYVVARLVLSYF